MIFDSRFPSVLLYAVLAATLNHAGYSRVVGVPRLFFIFRLPTTKQGFKAGRIVSDTVDEERILNIQKPRNKPIAQQTISSVLSGSWRTAVTNAALSAI